MPNWNRIIVGDAFKLPSRNLRFYLDLILWFPLLLAGLWLTGCFHGWRMAQWDLRQAGIGLAVVSVLLLLIKERTVVIVSIFWFLAHQAGLHYFFHGDTKALAYYYLLYGGGIVVLVVGVSFRVLVLKELDFDPTYRRPDRTNSWLGAVLVLGLLFGIGIIGIYFAWHDFPGFPRGVNVGLRSR
jgi:hypothetical protein